MRRRAVWLLSAITCGFLVTAAASAGPVVLFSDNFNDGDASGWWFDPTGTMPNWRVENGVLLNPLGDERALVEDLLLSSQSIQTSLSLNPEIFGSLGGVTLW
jgi:hypothetical protein